MDATEEGILLQGTLPAEDLVDLFDRQRSLPTTKTSARFSPWMDDRNPMEADAAVDESPAQKHRMEFVKSPANSGENFRDRPVASSR